MKTQLLHRIRQQHSKLNIGLAVVLLCWLATIQFSSWHDASHYLQPDTQCTLCVSTASSDNAIPAASQQFNFDVLNSAKPAASIIQLFTAELSINGNRDPPITPQF